MTSVYRNSDEAARLRLKELGEQRRQELAALPEDVDRVYARRVARGVAGGVAIAGFVVVVALILGATLLEESRGAFEAARGWPTAALALSWGAAALAYAASYRLALSRFRGEVARRFAPTGDLHADLDRLERLTPARVAGEVADRLEQRSVASPLVALSLLAPLSIHLVFALIATLPSSHASFDELRVFDAWIGMSLIIVGHAHLVLAYLAYRFAKKLRARPLFELEVPPRDGWAAWKITTGVSAIPGALIYLIPPLIVAVTGLLFIPLMFSSMNARVRFERYALALEEA